MEQWLTGGGFVGLLGFAAVLLIRLVHLLNGQIDRSEQDAKDWRAERDALRAEMDALHAANDRCEHRVTILLEAARDHGMPIPKEVFD